MKYLWIIMLGLAYVIWTISSIKDLIDAWRFPAYAIQESTGAWIVTTILVLFFWSFVLWL